jgi:signal transduction histidine kinase
VGSAHGRWRLADIALVVAVAAATESLVWTGKGPGTPIEGPRWLTAALPLLLALPLLRRRTRPLAMLLLVVTGVVLQAVVSSDAAEGLEIVVPLMVVAYSVAAFASPRHSEIGVAFLLAGYVVYCSEDRNVRYGGVGERWAAAFFGALFVTSWCLGLFVRARRTSREERERALEVEREAGLAVAEERARVARELHDIVSHNLSVVVLQAAGARARGGGEVDATLEKIEASGRDALVEMRRMLGVLRTEEGGPALSPQPGLADLEVLVGNVRTAGLNVRLDVELGGLPVPPAVALSAYRIVQESLTNTLKHAGASSATVHLRRDVDVLVVDVIDDGRSAHVTSAGGHGLIGMRERAAIHGGSLEAATLPDGGFRVHAVLAVPA